jgi:hypothetical protein
MKRHERIGSTITLDLLDKRTVSATITGWADSNFNRCSKNKARYAIADIGNNPIDQKHGQGDNWSKWKGNLGDWIEAQ